MGHREVRFSFQTLREFLASFFLCLWLDSRQCGEPDSVPKSPLREKFCLWEAGPPGAPELYPQPSPPPPFLTCLLCPRDLPSVAFPPDSPPPALWPPHPTSQSVAISLKFSWDCISRCLAGGHTHRLVTRTRYQQEREPLTDMQPHCPACRASGRHRWGGTSRKGMRKAGKGQAGEHTVTWVSSAPTLRGLFRHHPAQVPG